jgi:hypothetical protein
MSKWILEVVAIAISISAAGFSCWQAYEARQARLEARQSQIDARKESEDAQKLARIDSEKVQQLQRELAENAAKEAKRSADAAEKSAAALLATTRTFEATSQLRLDPNIEVEASFQPFGSPPTAPRIVLWNSGAADAVALTVALKLWVASPQTSADPWIMLNVSDILPDWRIPRLAAGEFHALEVKPQETGAPPGFLEGRQTRQPFIELVMRYLRPADRRNYEKRAYYFVSQNRRWVAENHPDSKTEINERIKTYLRKNPLWTRDYRPGLDLTHDVKMPAPQKR